MARLAVLTRHVRSVNFTGLSRASSVAQTLMKQRRPQSRPGKAHSESTPGSDSRRAASPADHLGGALTSGEAVNPSPPQPPRRSTYFEAVAVYERGLEALQR